MRGRVVPDSYGLQTADREQKVALNSESAPNLKYFIFCRRLRVYRASTPLGVTVILSAGIPYVRIRSSRENSKP
jgi:hypothetical protein